MGCGLDFADRLHEGILDSNGDIAARVTLTELRKSLVVFLFEFARSRSNSELKHPHTCRCVWQADVDSPLETSSNGGVELPWNVGSSKDQDTLRVSPHTVHLHQEFGLDSPRGFRLTLTSRTTQSVNLVDEDD